ncbi:hypothetical protein BH11PLA2_BH11PLA2_47910 [soil metagenome]
MPLGPLLNAVTNTLYAGIPERPTAPVLPTVPGYEVLELVGRGGMGKVYRARHRDLDRIAAIKVLLHEPDDKLLARFREETRAVARLQHPNIAQLFDSGTVDGRPYYSQEFVDGGTLGQKLAGKPQDPAAAAATLATIARAIQHCHDHGILHRDLKPGNILLAADGTPKVTDFGLAKAMPPPDNDGDTATAGLTQTGDIVGTPAYMPPEQASGITAHIGPAADVYSLGAILYEMLTGRPPFQSPDALQTLLLVLSMDPVPPRMLQPKLPRDLETICLQCLEKSPKKRYVSAAALAEDLDRFLNDLPIVARPVGVLERTAKWARRRKAVAALIMLSAFFAVGLAFATGWLVVKNAQLDTANRDLETANTNLVAAKNESDKAYTLANATVDRMVRDISVKLDGVPQAEGLMLDVISRSSDLYRELSEVRPSDDSVIMQRLRALSMRSAYETNYNRHDAAARTRRELDEILQRELARRPDDADLRFLELRLAFDSANDAQSQNQPAIASLGRAEYFVLVDRFVEKFPERMDSLPYVVRKHWFRGFDAAARGDTDARTAALRDAVAASKLITEAGGRLTFVSSSLSQLGNVLSNARRLAEADAVFAELQGLYASPSAATGSAEYIRAGLAEVQVKRAGIAMDENRFHDSLVLYALAEPTLRVLVKDFPLTRIYHLSLAECLFWQGFLQQGSNPARAAAFADEAVAVMDAQLKRRPNATDQSTRDNYVSMRRKFPPPEGK